MTRPKRTGNRQAFHGPVGIRNESGISAVQFVGKRMYRRTGFAVAAALLLTLGFNAVSAAAADKKDKNDQLGQRSVQGAVTDSKDNPVSGAVVYIKNAKTLQIRSFITKDEGTYYFHSLSPDVD